MVASINQLQASIHRKKGRSAPRLKEFMPEPFEPQDIPEQPKQTPEQMKEAFIGAMKTAGVEIIYKHRYDPHEYDEEEEE